MKRIFIFSIAAIMLANIGVTAQNGDMTELQKRMKFQSEQQKSNLNEQRKNKKHAQVETALRSGEVSYTTLNYSTLIPVGGAATSGSATVDENSVIDAYDWLCTGRAYSFTAQEGKVYKITCTFTTAHFFDNYLGVLLFKDGSFYGDDYDIAVDVWSRPSNQKEVTVSNLYVAYDNINVRMLIYDNSVNNYNYTITVEEVYIPSYTTLNYSNLIPTNGAQEQGSFSAQNNTALDWYNYLVAGKGYSFNTQVGKTYKITCKYVASEEKYYLGPQLFVLKSGTLTGYDDDVITSYGNLVYEASSEVTVTGYFAGNGATVRLLLYDYYYNSNDLDYTIIIEELNIPSYTALNYSTIISANGTPVQGSFTEQNDMVLDWNYYTFTGKGYSFNAQSGKTYKITCKYVASQETDLYTELYILTGGTLTGYYYDDVITNFGNWNYGTEVTVTCYFVGNGDIIRLLLCDYNLHDLSYTITIEEVYIPTLTDLLNSTTKTIVYSNNMQFTSNGFTDDMVLGDESLPFRWNNRLYYAVAYKITLAAGNFIKIHSSKEGDSYLYLYKSDGAGGYVYVDSNDDYYGNLDSYLEFTAYEAGVYYIVVTDVSRESAGRYFLTVWNTPDEPYNEYSGVNNIPAANLATVYTSGKNIIVSNVETGSQIIVADIAGRIITNTTASSSEITLPVSVGGVYIVRVGKQTVKVVI